MSLENITAKILADAEKDAKRTVNEAKDRAQKKRDLAQRVGEQLIRSEQKKAEDNAEGIMQRRLSVAGLDTRKLLLTEKQKGIDACFAQSVDRIAALPKDDYIAFLVKGISNSMSDGDELLLNERDQTEVGEQVLSLIEAMGKKLSLSKQPLKAKGGFVLRHGEIEINATLEALVGDVREELTPEVAKVLYGE